MCKTNQDELKITTNESYPDFMKNVIPAFNPHSGLKIDPWDTRLTDDDKQVIVDKIKDVWYFLKYIIKISDRFSDRLTNIQMNSGTNAFVYLYENNQSAIFIASKHAFGKSTILEALYLHSILTNPNGREYSIYLPYQYIKERKRKIVVPKFVEKLLNNIYMENFDRIMDDISDENGASMIFHKDRKYFLDDLMICGMPKTYNPAIEQMKFGKYFATSTIGFSNAELVRYTIPFTNEMYTKDLKVFETVFRETIGYNPSYLIRLGYSDIEDIDERKYLDQLRIDMKEEEYRKRIGITPDWKM